MKTKTMLTPYLDQFSGPLRLALDALVACSAAHVAAWRANGSPTDGTMDRLQHATQRAVEEANRLVLEACAEAQITRGLEILAEVRRLAELEA